MTWEIIGGVASLILVAVILAMKGTRWHDSTENRLKNLEKKVDRILRFIQRNYKNSIERSSSPLTLTDYGQKLAQQARSSDIADIYTEKIFRLVKNKNPYEIQEYCFKFCEDDLLPALEEDGHHELRQGVFDVAYEEGEDLWLITRVIAHEFRNRILERLGKSLTDIDEFEDKDNEIDF